MKRGRKNNPGTASSTRQSRSQSKTTRSTEIISKFFKKSENNPKSQPSNEIKEFHECSRFNDDDFVEPPPPPAKVAKIFIDAKERINSTSTTTRKTRSAKTKSKNISNEEKKLKAIAKTSDVNMEHLQLAIALSKSVQTQSIENNEKEEEDNPYPSTQQIIDTAKASLLPYQYKTGQKTNSENAIAENVRINKRSKFRFMKPLLLRRTDSEREALLQTKIYNVLLPCNNSIENSLQDKDIANFHLHSEILQGCYDENRKFFNLSNQTFKEQEVYYVESLNIEKSTAVMGHLLKRWDLIAGREKSPDREFLNDQHLNKQIPEVIDLPSIEKCELIEDISNSTHSKSSEVVDEASKQFNETNEEVKNQNTCVTLEDSKSFLTCSSSSSFPSVSQINPPTRSESPDLFESSSEDESHQEVSSLKFCGDKFTIKDDERDAKKQTGEVLHNQNLIKKVNEENSCNDREISILLTENKQEIEESDIQNGKEKLLNNKEKNIINTENLASVSILSHINNANDSDISDRDLKLYEEVDAKGICYYESFCEFEENTFNNSNEENSIDLLHEKTNEIITDDNVNESKDILSKDMIYESKDISSNADNITNSNYRTINVSPILQTDAEHKKHNESLPSETNRKRLSYYIDKLLNANNSNYEIGSVYLDESLNSTMFSDHDKTIIQSKDDAIKEIAKKSQDKKIINGGTEIEKDNDFMDLSQDKDEENINEIEDCVDLSQDSDDDTSKTKVELLNNDDEIYKTNFQQHASFASSISLNESICISDEELNYSCLNSSIAPTESIKTKEKQVSPKKSKFVISDSENEKDNDSNDESGDFDGSINVEELLARLKQQATDSNGKSTNKEINTSIIIDLDDENDSDKEDNDEDNDPELQEAIKLSLSQANNDLSNKEIDKQVENCLTSFDNDDVFKDSFNFPSINIESEETTKDNNYSLTENLCDAGTSFNNHQVNIVEVNNEVEFVTNELVISTSKNETKDIKNYNQKHDNNISEDEENNTKENTEPDEFDQLVNSSSIFHKKQKPKDKRVQELIDNNKTLKLPIVKKGNCSMFDDTLGNLLEQTNILQNIENLGNKSKTPCKTSPVELSIANSIVSATPKTPHDGLYIKTNNITPMPEYDNMTTPEIHEELDKFGVKRLKRQRGVQMLKHIYNSTHLPLQQYDLNDGLQQNVNNDLENPEVDTVELSRPKKRRKKLNYDSLESEIDESQDKQIQKFIVEQEQELQINRKQPEGKIEINNKISVSESVEEMIFERKFSKRIASCALPFHIAWHNFLCVNRNIWENVLLYEPLQVEVIYAMFKELGFKYHIQDMISYFDKKCITIRIKQN